MGRMKELQKQLHAYIQTPQDAYINAKLGEEYEKIGQGAAAHSYFLRAAELLHTYDPEMAYCCVLKIEVDFFIAKILKRKITRNQTKDQPAILRPKNFHGISAQLPSPINNALITSANGNTSMIYSRGGPHNGTSSSGNP